MTNMTIEQKFTFMLAKKLKGEDIKPELNTLTSDELVQFRKWIGTKKSVAEEKLWKQKQAERATE